MKSKEWHKIINAALLIMTAILTFINLRDRFKKSPDKEGQVSLVPPTRTGEQLYNSLPESTRQYVDRMVDKARQLSGIKTITAPQIINELIDRGQLILTTKNAA